MGTNSPVNDAKKEMVKQLFTTLSTEPIETRRLVLASRIRLVFVFPLLYLFAYAYLTYYPSYNLNALMEVWVFKLMTILAISYLAANGIINYLTKWPLLVERINYGTIIIEIATIQLFLLWGGALSSPGVLLLLSAVVVYRIGLNYYHALFIAALGGLVYAFTVLVEATGLIPGYPEMAAIYNSNGAAAISIAAVFMCIFITFVITNYTVNQIVGLNHQLEEQSTRDGLTGIPNRRYFEEHLMAEWYRARRSLKPLSLIMIDIDNFKAYNDTYGHLNGDECLKKVAVSLHKGARRAADVVARLGGEEFVVLLPETTLDGAASLAEKLRLQIEMLDIPNKHSSLYGKVTISLGVASLIPSPTLRPDDLLEHADKALYRAKRLGRNRVSVDFVLPYPQHN